MDSDSVDDPIDKFISLADLNYFEWQDEIEMALRKLDMWKYLDPNEDGPFESHVERRWPEELPTMGWRIDHTTPRKPRKALRF